MTCRHVGGFLWVLWFLQPKKLTKELMLLIIKFLQQKLMIPRF